MDPRLRLGQRDESLMTQQIYGRACGTVLADSRRVGFMGALRFNGQKTQNPMMPHMQASTAPAVTSRG